MYLDVEYNGVKGSSLGIFARERPAIPAAKKKRKEIKILGRSGSLWVEEGGYEQTEVEVDFNYIGPEDAWWERWRRAQEWLSGREGILRFSDDDGYFFWVSKVDLEENERSSLRTGRFTAVFCTKDGLSYLNSGLREHAPGDIRWNPHLVAYPVYKITGEGKFELSVNGKKFEADVGQNLTIDTERMIAYREDGTLRNADVTGEYEDIILPEGEISIEHSPGFLVRIIPNWRRL